MRHTALGKSVKKCLNSKTRYKTCSFKNIMIINDSCCNAPISISLYSILWSWEEDGPNAHLSYVLLLITGPNTITPLWFLAGQLSCATLSTPLVQQRQPVLRDINSMPSSGTQAQSKNSTWCHLNALQRSCCKWRTQCSSTNAGIPSGVGFVFVLSITLRKKKAHTQNVTAPFYLNTNLKYTDIYIDTFSACKKKQLKSKTVKIILIEATSDWYLFISPFIDTRLPVLRPVVINTPAAWILMWKCTIISSEPFMHIWTVLE